MQGRIHEYINLFTPEGKRKQRLTLELDEDFRGRYDKLNGKDLDIEITLHREKRSKDANAYFWQLCGKLSAVIRTPPDEIYREYIRDIGGNYTVVPVLNEAVDLFCYSWEYDHGKRKLGWLTETFPSKISGYTNVRAFYGSSTYDKAQMGRLIDFLVEDCKENGIETRTPDEIANLLSLWESDYARYQAKENDEVQEKQSV